MNEYPETTAENVWPRGDVAGNASFEHPGDYETRQTVAKVVHEERTAIDLSATGRAKKLDRGFVTMLAAPDAEILGAHAVGHEASTLLNEAVVAMRTDASVADVAGTIHAHPTLSNVVEAASRDVTSRYPDRRHV
ncbi:hypothetical protein [Haloarchaeobius sp. HRN-SO-5]|uniref:hypothetical protein n=1 Tax=Haloarchaeobius sp. HRN-SO-5 TaxID=3446118 RepID=UPI003EC1086B